MNFTSAVLLPAAFILGSIPFGFIAGRLKGKDLREHGSKNIGATNTLRVLGVVPGILVLLLDASKGFLPVWIAKSMGMESLFIVLAGIAAMIGHIYSPFLGFKGGKGVATALGVAIGLSPIASAIGVAVFIVTVLITRYVSLGSLLGAITLAALLFILPMDHPDTDPLPSRVFGVIAASFIVLRHRENIKRLLKGTENRFEYKKQSANEGDRT